MSKVTELLTGKLDARKKLAIVCASLMSQECATCAQSVKVRLHREPNLDNAGCIACVRAKYAALWKEDCTCIK